MSIHTFLTFKPNTSLKTSLLAWLATICARWHGQSLIKISEFFSLKREAREFLFPTMVLALSTWYTILVYCPSQSNFQLLQYARSCSPMFPFCQAHIIKVISNEFRSVNIICTNTNWIRFLNTSVITAICATTRWIILTMLNYKVMTICTKSLIYSSNGLGSCWTIWWSNLSLWKHTFK